MNSSIFNEISNVPDEKLLDMIKKLDIARLIE
jgi:hypothetical protein